VPSAWSRWVFGHAGPGAGDDGSILFHYRNGDYKALKTLVSAILDRLTLIEHRLGAVSGGGCENSAGSPPA